MIKVQTLVSMSWYPIVLVQVLTCMFGLLSTAAAPNAFLAQDKIQNIFCQEVSPVLCPGNYTVLPNMVRTTLPGSNVSLFVYAKGDIVSQQILMGKGWETGPVKEVIRVMEASKSPNPLYVDVGANVGSLVLQVAAASARFRSVAFEAMPSNILALRCSACDPLYDQRLIIVNQGLSNTTANCSVVSQNTNQGDGNVVCTKEELDAYMRRGYVVRSTIPVKPLDSFIASDVDVLKIDVEGHIEHVLKGSMGLIRQHYVKHMILELWKKTKCMDYVRELVHDLGYNVSVAGFDGPWLTLDNVQERLDGRSILDVYMTRQSMPEHSRAGIQLPSGATAPARRSRRSAREVASPAASGRRRRRQSRWF